MEDRKKTKDTNNPKVQCACGSYIIKINYNRHLKSNKHKKFIDPNVVCVTKNNFTYNEEGNRIIKTKGRPALTQAEKMRKYLADPENRKKHNARIAKSYHKRKKAYQYCIENNIEV